MYFLMLRVLENVRHVQLRYQPNPNPNPLEPDPYPGSILIEESRLPGSWKDKVIIKQYQMKANKSNLDKSSAD